MTEPTPGPDQTPDSLSDVERASAHRAAARVGPRRILRRPPRSGDQRLDPRPLPRSRQRPGPRLHRPGAARAGRTAARDRGPGRSGSAGLRCRRRRAGPPAADLGTRARRAARADAAGAAPHRAARLAVAGHAGAAAGPLAAGAAAGNRPGALCVALAGRAAPAAAGDDRGRCLDRRLGAWRRPGRQHADRRSRGGDPAGARRLGGLPRARRGAVHRRARCPMRSPPWSGSRPAIGAYAEAQVLRGRMQQELLRAAGLGRSAGGDRTRP